MYVKSIHLENLKTFKNTEFDLERPDGTFAGWTVFVGGNSSGKSTLLKAAALALMGPESGRQLIGDGIGWIRQNEKKAQAVVEIDVDPNHDGFKKRGRGIKRFKDGVRWFFKEVGDRPEFRALDRRKKETDSRIKTADGGPWNPNARGWFAAGYGPMRRLSGASNEAIRFAYGPVVRRFATLFREDAALSESEEWLRITHARTLEEDLSEPLRNSQKLLLEGVTKLLGDGLLPNGMNISRITVDHVFVQDRQGIELPMRDISDGCRGVYATLLDLIHNMFEVYGADGLFKTLSNGTLVVDRPGVVLIDEIEAHLHPAWQRDIPEWLKKHFPRIQFLVTTHSPLIAQAADENGIFLLPLQDEIDREPRALTATEYERIRWGSAHKTVLGVAFGLSSTRSRWADKQIAHWQRLDAKKKAGVGLTREEERNYGRLERQLELNFDDSNLNSLDNYAENSTQTESTLNSHSTAIEKNGLNHEGRQSET